MNQIASAAPVRRHTAKEAAVLLGLSSNSIYAHIRVGHIKAVRLGRKIIVLGEEIDRVLRQGMPTVHPSPADATAKPAHDPLG